MLVIRRLTVAIDFYSITSLQYVYIFIYFLNQYIIPTCLRVSEVTLTIYQTVLIFSKISLQSTLSTFILYHYTNCMLYFILSF